MSKEKDRLLLPGERETKLAFEEATRRNVLAIVKYSQDTKAAVNDLQIRVNAAENNVLALRKLIEQQRDQLSKLQQQFYLKGSTSYADNDKLANEGDQRP